MNTNSYLEKINNNISIVSKTLNENTYTGINKK